MRSGLVALVFFAALSSVLQADEVQDRIDAIKRPEAGWVADVAGVVQPRMADVNSLITDYERETSGEMAIVVVPTIGEQNPREFAVKLFAAWGIGKKGKDNGILVFHVMDQRRVEIETGYGMEGDVPDVACARIIDEIAIPFFKASSFADGHYEIIRALIRAAKTKSRTLSALTVDLKTKPGQSVQKMPDIPRRDAIARKNAPIYLRIMQNLFLQIGVLIASIGLVAFVIIRFARNKTGVATKDHDSYSKAHNVGYWAPLGFGIFAALFEYSNYLTLYYTIPTFLAALIGWFAFTWIEKSRIRKRPRVCAKCGKTMKLLPLHTLAEKSKYLNDSEQMKQGTGRADFDIWLCECKEVLKEKYLEVWIPENTNSGGSTTTSTTTSSDGSSAGSSSGGGSFGGGRSGGGGAGGNY